MRKHRNRLKRLFQRGFMCDGINAKSEPADDQYIIGRKFPDQFFRNLFSIIRIPAGANNGNDFELIEICIAFVKQQNGRIISKVIIVADNLDLQVLSARIPYRSKKCNFFFRS